MIEHGPRDAFYSGLHDVHPVMECLCGGQFHGSDWEGIGRQMDAHLLDCARDEKPHHDPMECQGHGGYDKNGIPSNASDDPCWVCIDWAFDELESLKQQNKEMLEALKRIIDVRGERDKVLITAEAAIAKADRKS